MYSAVTLDVGTNILNHVPCQWYSGTRMITYELIWYHTILWVLYKAISMSDTLGSLNGALHDLQLHLRHAQMLPWILEQGVWVMLLVSGIVVQWWWHRDGYGMQPFYEYSMRYGPCLTGMHHPVDHHMTTNDSLDSILSCYPGYWNQELEQCTSSVV